MIAMLRTRMPAALAALALLTAGCRTRPAAESQVTISERPALPAPVEPLREIPEQLTLDASKSFALQRNPDMAVASARVRRAAALLLQTRAALYPRVAAGLSAAHTQDTPSRQGGSAGSFAVDPFETYAGSISGSWLLFDASLRRFNILAAGQGRQAATHAQDNARRLLALAEAGAFYATLLAQKQVEIAKTDAEFNQVLLDETLKRMKYQRASRLQELNFRIRLNNARTGQLGAERELQTALIALAELLGLPNAAMPATTSLQPPVIADDEEPLDAQELLLAAGQERPDLRQLSAQASAARYAAEAKRRELYPTLSVEGSYGVSRQDSLKFEKGDRASRLGLALGWEVFDADRRRQAHRQALAEADAVESQWERLKLAVAAEIGRALEDIRTARKLLAIQRQTIAWTKETREREHKKYLQGGTSLTRLNEAQSDLVIAQSNLAAREIALLQAAEALQAAVANNLPAR